MVYCIECLLKSVEMPTVYLFSLKAFSISLKSEIQIVSYRDDIVKDTCKVCCSSASPIVWRNIEALILVYN